MTAFLLDPNVAYVLLVSGMVLTVLALMTPGTGVLEIGALFALFLAGYSILHLSINVWALVVLVLGVVPFLLSLRRARHWIFLLISLVAFTIGTIFLFRTKDGVPAIQPFLAVVVTISALSILWIIGRRGLEAFLQTPAFDLRKLQGMIGEAHSDISVEGTVYVNGEEWSARSTQAVSAGSRVRVVGRDGLALLVEPVEERDSPAG